MSKSTSTKTATTTTRREKRTALEDVTNVEQGVELEDAEQPPKKRVKASATSTVLKKPAGRGRKKQVEENHIIEVPAIQDATEITVQTEATESSAIYESVDAGGSLEDVVSEVVLPVSRANGRTRTRSRSRQPESTVSHGRSGATASNVEKGTSDPVLRRRLGEMTTKYDTLEARFNSLKDVASMEAQSNFDKLKAATDRQAKAQDNLIASLRKQIAMQKDVAGETRALHSQLAAAQVENQRLGAENKSFSAEIKSLKEHYTKSQNDIKTLHAKLASSRAQSEGAQSTKSANMKNPSTQISASAQVMNLKEDLYCDVTGLIIHNVKRSESKIVYDCSQTGRNGSKLTTLLCYEMEL
jgi:predicted  nucleic acid-binding Zn-ribbon protein